MASSEHPSSTLQQQHAAYLLSLQRQLQQLNQGATTSSANTNEMQPHRQQQHEDSLGQVDSSSFVNESRGRLATTSRALVTSQLDTILAENTTFRRNEVEQAIRALRGGQRSTFEDNHATPSSSLLVPTSRILPLGVTNRAPFQHDSSPSRESVNMLPSVLQAAAFRNSQGYLTSGSTGGARVKRKADDEDDDGLDKLYSNDSDRKKQAIAVPTVTNNSFPMPSLKSKRNVHTSGLLSFHSLWADLDHSEMQEEIFRQRIYGTIKIVGNSSRSIKKTIRRG